MKSFALGLSMATVMLGTAFADVIDPNTPTGPYNPNPPAQLTGGIASAPCNPAPNVASNGPGNGMGATPPAAPAGQPQATAGDRQAAAAKDQPAAGAGCAGPDHPTGATGPAPTNAPHP